MTTEKIDGVSVTTQANVYFDGKCVSHGITFADGTKSATQTTGTYARTFATAGTYAYECTVHSGMTGSVTVR